MTDLAEDRKKWARDFIEARLVPPLLHGDETHQLWLRKELRKWIPGLAEAAYQAGLKEAGPSKFNELRAAAQAVVWFDWSDNDEDAVRAVDRLREVVNSGDARVEQTPPPGKKYRCSTCGEEYAIGVECDLCQEPKRVGTSTHGQQNGETPQTAASSAAQASITARPVGQTSPQTDERSDRFSSTQETGKSGASGVAQTPPTISIGHGAPPGIGPAPGSKPITVESLPPDITPEEMRGIAQGLMEAAARKMRSFAEIKAELKAGASGVAQTSQPPRKGYDDIPCSECGKPFGPDTECPTCKVIRGLDEPGVERMTQPEEKA